jgi:hypothetical protein
MRTRKLEFLTNGVSPDEGYSAFNVEAGSILIARRAGK